MLAVLVDCHCYSSSSSQFHNLLPVYCLLTYINYLLTYLFTYLLTYSMEQSPS
jgi:hypothetical protein